MVVDVDHILGPGSHSPHCQKELLDRFGRITAGIDRESELDITAGPPADL